MTTFHYIDGEIIPASEAAINPCDLGFLRGYGVFDYVPLYSGRPFHLRQHIQRLCQSAKEIQLDLPFSLEQIEAAALALIEKNAPINAGIRLIITGGMSGKEAILPKSRSALFILFFPTTPYKNEYYEHGMKAITVKIERYLPHVKSINYVPAILAMKQAQEAQADDALYLDNDNGIVEGTTCNVFFIKNGILITNNSSQLIKGVTRDVILNLAQDHYQIEHRALNISEISSCDEAFLTSSIKDLIPLVQIDRQTIGSGLPGPLTSHLRSLFHSYVENYLHEQKNTWGATS